MGKKTHDLAMMWIELWNEFPEERAELKMMPYGLE